MGKNWSCWSNFRGTLNQLNIHNFIESPIFYGRRKGRKLSKSDQIALNEGKRYLIKKEDLSKIYRGQFYGINNYSLKVSDVIDTIVIAKIVDLNHPWVEIRVGDVIKLKESYEMFHS